LCHGRIDFILIIFSSAGDYFLSYWVEREEGRKPTPLTRNDTVLETFSESPEGLIAILFSSVGIEYDQTIDIYIFSGIIALTVVMFLSRSFLFFNVAMRASRHLHNAMFEGVSRATMYFFNTNPSGRILNRFSKDMGQVDEILPSIMIEVIEIFVSLLGTILIISIVNPWNLIPAVVIFVLFYTMNNFYLHTSRKIKRLEATTRSPVYSHLAATLNGLSTIRALNAESLVTAEFDSHQDLHSSAFYLFMSISRTFGLYVDICCVFYLAIVLGTFFLRGGNGGNVGLAITQVLGLTTIVPWGMRQSALLENTMTSVERIIEYNDIDPEPKWESEPDQKPPPSWPEEGRIKFDKLTMRYCPDPKSNTVLKQLDFEILPKEKIGIVGRTGAGKSSVINALFRLSYTEGAILIDSRDIHLMGIHEVRSKISMIPQEPVLFSGSLRYNLDPFDEYTDDKIWRALEDVKLKEVIQARCSNPVRVKSL
jgi:ATP-binding cassette subfamily C (CFTR/MRP) protein 4